MMKSAIVSFMLFSRVPRNNFFLWVKSHLSSKLAFLVKPNFHDRDRENNSKILDFMKHFYKQHPEAEILLFENYLFSSSTL